MGFRTGWEYNLMSGKSFGPETISHDIGGAETSDPTAQIEIEALLDLMDDEDYGNGRNAVRVRLASLSDQYLDYLRSNLSKDPRLPEGNGHISDLDMILFREVSERVALRIVEN